MRARTGKIARLPEAIREQLNQRLFDGIPGRKIIPWLGTLPEVQRIMAEQFTSVPISENNLSEWRRGGYQDWLREKQARTEALQFTQKCLRMKPEDRFRYIESILLTEFGNMLGALRDIPDTDLRMRRLQGLSREFVRMHKFNTHGLQSQLHHEKSLSTRYSKPCQPLNTV
jgi:hypothetical protein